MLSASTSPSSLTSRVADRMMWLLIRGDVCGRTFSGGETENAATSWDRQVKRAADSIAIAVVMLLLLLLRTVLFYDLIGYRHMMISMI